MRFKITVTEWAPSFIGGDNPIIEEFETYDEAARFLSEQCETGKVKMEDTLHGHTWLMPE